MFLEYKKKEPINQIKTTKIKYKSFRKFFLCMSIILLFARAFLYIYRSINSQMLKLC